MLHINRIRIEITTSIGLYGFDHTFNNNKDSLFWSLGNSVGKSSILSCIYYGLGLEELIGGQGKYGKKVLSRGLKSAIKINGEEKSIIKSCVYLEISNGSSIITILRPITTEQKNGDLLATIFKSNIDQIFTSTPEKDFYYVHGPNSAKNSAGFFTYLESFLKLQLPLVPTSKGSETKLYLQLIFSGIFIEQKRGWADLFSAMPHFGIKEAKKRVIEYILNLDSLDIENQRKKILNKEYSLKNSWNDFIEFNLTFFKENHIYFENLEKKTIPILNNETDIIKKIIKNDTIYTIDQYTKFLKSRLASLTHKDQLINNTNHVKKLQSKLEETLENISELEHSIEEGHQILNIEKTNIISLEKSIQQIEKDIQDTKDALKLAQLGADLKIDSFNGICPTCKQKISDTVLTETNYFKSANMSLENNILHLKAQKEVLDFSLQHSKDFSNEVSEKIDGLINNKVNLENLARVIKMDIFTTSEGYSKTTLVEIINIENELSNLESLQTKIKEFTAKILDFSDNWVEILENKKNLPKTNLTSHDKKTLSILRNYFVNNLISFNPKSIIQVKNPNVTEKEKQRILSSIVISEDTYLPSIDGFDLKFDSSASDNIRSIWAFTIALLQTSNTVGGKHPGILIFDEPGQQSMENEDLKNFFTIIQKIPLISQSIITVALQTEKNEFSSYFKENENLDSFFLETYAFQPLESPTSH